MKLNNHGQTLVLFVLIIPVLFLVIGYVVNLGMMNVSKKNIDVTIQNILQSSMKELNKKDSETLKNDIQKTLIINLGNIESKIIIEDKIQINVKKRLNNIFPFLIKEQYYEVTYEGILDNEQIQIIRR